MESISLLSYWKAAGNMPASVALPKSSVSPPPTPPPPPAAANTDDIESYEDGSFFSLELILPKYSSCDDTDESEDDDDENKELNFITTSSQGNKIPLEPKPQIALPLLKSAAKLTFFKLDHQKADSAPSKPNASPKQRKFSSNCKVKEVPIVSIFDFAGDSIASKENSSSNSNDFVHKYLRKIKPLYVRVLNNKAEETAKKTGEKNQKPTLSARLWLACERLAKCKSSSSAVPAVSSPQRRDDSLLLQQDGIQSAIAHCKRSFKEVSEDMELKWEKGVKILTVGEGGTESWFE